MTKTLYALAVGDDLLAIRESSNAEDAEYCNSTTAELVIASERANAIFAADTLFAAETVAKINTAWYNSSVDTPINKFAGKCRVVKLTVEEIE